MLKFFSVFIILILTGSLSGQIAPDARQRAWLYRVVSKTPVLNANAASCFQFNQKPFYRFINGQWFYNWDAAEQYMLRNPDSLAIDYSCLKNMPNGLLGELSVKLALYELIYHLKMPRYDGELTDTIALKLSRDLIRALPDGLSGRPQTRRARAIVDVVMNPSLPVIRKVKDLTEMEVLPEEQLVVMNKWVQIVSAWAESRGNSYYRFLTDNYNVNNINVLRMIAAGDGSGTAGLLDEKEIDPKDSVETGYGRGTGLFTYKYSVSESVVKSQLQNNESVELPANAVNAIHCSLWGLDSRIKPLVVVTCNNKSYHLFSIDNLGYLSPDENAGDGISYMQRIQQMVEQKVNKPMAKMNSTEGLRPIIENELALKANIESQMHRLENEIDSLKKQQPVNQAAIDVRMVQINTSLTNLTAKERRIKELERKLAAQTTSVDNSRKVIEEMQNLIGPNPQKWTRQGELFTFADGVQFNILTQDLIFPISTKPQKAKIGLVSASMTLSGELRDEVQIFVNLTHPKQIVNQVVVDKVANNVNYSVRYVPDAIKPISSIDSVVYQLKQLIGNKPCELEVMLNYPTAPSPTYSSLQREMQLPLTENGKKRSVTLTATEQNDGWKLTIIASTDGVATRLSSLSEDDRGKLGVSLSSHLNNKYLAALRGGWLALKVANQLTGEVTIVKPGALTDVEWQIIKDIIELN